MMSEIFEEWIKQSGEKYQEVRKLIDIDSKNDPFNEPYKSKYEARKILQDLESDLNTFQSNGKGELFSKIPLMKALINYELGVIASDVEEFTLGKDILEKCWDSVKDKSMQPEYGILSINILNNLAVIWSMQNDPQKACELLKHAEVIYTLFTNTNEKMSLDPSGIFSIETINNSHVNETALEKAHTHTLYYLAQVYEHLGENEKATVYCHATLKRQLKSGDFDPIDWSVNCATLAQYFVGKGEFRVARHYLACASYTLTSYEQKLLKEEIHKTEEQCDMLKRAKADVSKIWAKYGIMLLACSKDQRLKDSDLPKAEVQETPNQPHIFLTNPEVQVLEETIPCKHIKNFEGARLVFLTCQKHANESQTYYTLNEYATDYVLIIQDISKLYKLLAAFETDSERQCKMHKRRVDIMEETLNALNPQHYLLICRQLIFELAEIYSEMMDIKLSMQDIEHGISPHAAKKVNLLAGKSIQKCQAFVDSLKNSDKNLPERFPDDVVRPAIIAFLYLGRLHGKIIVPERQKQIENLSLSEKYYQFIVDYIRKNPDQEKCVKDESEIAKELLQLIPGKIQTLLSSALHP